MRRQNTFLIAFLLSFATSSALFSQEVIRVVGSSTVYPFSSAVAEEFGLLSKYKTPLVESTGSGGGFKLFCAGVGKSTPHITNASRRIKTKEFKNCLKNGVTSMTEVMIGYDGIVLASSKATSTLKVTLKQILLALAAKVPSSDGKSLVDNPYTNWNQIDASLPNRTIRVYGPPTSSGTRDAFEELVLQALSKKMPAYGKKKYSKVREDGVYIPSGENDNLIVKKLLKDKVALGIFGFGFLQENTHKVKASLVGGVAPTPKTIANKEYPVARSLFFYVKNAKRSKSVDEFIELFLSEDIAGEEGYLAELGLISLEDDVRQKITNSVMSKKALTMRGLKQGH